MAAEQKWYVYASPVFEEFAAKWGKVERIERGVFDNNFPNIFVGGSSFL